MVGVKPVGGPEHGKEEDDEGLESNSLPEPDELGLPGWVLHEHDAGSVRSDNIIGVAEHEGQNGTAKHENDEGDVGSVGDCFVGLDVDILAERDLRLLDMPKMRLLGV